MLTARFLQDVVDVVRESGDIIRRQWEKTHAVRHKGSIDLVTETDVAVEAFLKERLGELLPQAEFLAEESCVAGQEPSPLCWIIDPVDGTTNFVHRIPQVGTSVALWADGHVVLGVVNVPMMDECFWAGLGMGAFRNGEPIHVSSAEVLSDAVVATGFPRACAVSGPPRWIWPMWPPGGRTPSTRCCSSPGTWLPAGCWWKKPAGGSRRWMDVRIPSGTRSWPATAWCTRNCGICWRP